MYLLDTNIFGYFVRNQGGVVEKVNSVSKYFLYTNTIVTAEIFFGIENTTSVEKRSKYRQIYDGILSNITVLDFDIEAAKVFSKVKSESRKSGDNIDDFDILIASTAISHNLTLVTHNTKHFGSIPGLKLEDWYEEVLG